MESISDINDYKKNPRFEVDSDGLWWHGVDKDGEPQPKLWICSPLRITAATRDDNAGAWGRLLEFEDGEGNPKSWAMPMRLLAGDGGEYRAVLLDMGLHITPGRRSRELLTQYIQTTKTNRYVRCVERTGWYRDTCFILPDAVIGGVPGERPLLQTATNNTQLYRQAGTLNDWQRGVAAYCVHNSRLTFAVSCAFASMLIGITGDENGGFHLRGESSTGKTTLLAVAASVFGGKQQIQRWKSTGNGLESIAAAHNDALLILDELAQVDAREAGEIAYMLGNGTGKQRADKYGSARQKHAWRLLYLSSGEVSLADHQMTVGKRTKAGQETRLADVPVNTGKHGAFEWLHGLPNGDAFSRMLVSEAQTSYGTAAREFLECLVMQPPGEVSKRIEDIFSEFTGRLLPADASGQVRRVARRFALVAAGGDLATTFKITGWPQGEALSAAVDCFKAWLSARGGVTQLEERAVLQQVRLFFQQHGDARFAPWDSDHRPILNRAGFRKYGTDGEEFYVFPEVFKVEICQGIDPGFAARVLNQHGLLMTSGESRYTRVERLPEVGQKRCYRFTNRVLGD